MVLIRASSIVFGHGCLDYLTRKARLSAEAVAPKLWHGALSFGASIEGVSNQMFQAFYVRGTWLARLDIS